MTSRGIQTIERNTVGEVMEDVEKVWEWNVSPP